MKYQFVFVAFIFFSSCGDVEKSTIIKPEKQIVIDGLKHPWSIAFLNETDVLITEKDGDLLRVDLQTGNRVAMKGLPEDLVDSIRMKDFRDNSGLFEVLLHPNFKENQWIYLSYAAENKKGTTTKVIRARLLTDSLAEIKTIFVADPYREDLFHYGGGMTFGEDEKLYITIGERHYNEIDQPPIPVAQDLSDKRGKIHRLMDDGSIPDDNPNFGEQAISSIYAAGIRAAQGITVNKETGDIWFSDHGAMQGDELNLLLKGANYGWPIRTTGKHRNSEYNPPDIKTDFIGPKHYWLQTIAPTGLVFYYGEDFPSWQGNIILSGLSRGSLWRLVIENNTIISAEELFINDRIRSRKIAMSPEGSLYMLTDEADGKLLMITNSSSKPLKENNPDLN